MTEFIYAFELTKRKNNIALLSPLFHKLMGSPDISVSSFSFSFFFGFVLNSLPSAGFLYKILFLINKRLKLSGYTGETPSVTIDRETCCVLPQMTPTQGKEKQKGELFT